MSEWKEYKLGDFLKVKHGYAFKGENIVTEETPNILVTPGNFNIGGGFKSDKFKYYKGDEFPKEYILKSGDIVVTMTDLSKDSDTLGYSAKIPYSTNHNYLHNQRIGLVQFVNENVCKDFVYWLMRTREYQNYIVGSASGTSIMHTSPSRIEDYRCLIPPLPEQKRIASILSSLDDKIDLLHRENKTLEAMAETLFRQWFIEEAKEDWEEVLITDLFEVKDGTHDSPKPQNFGHKLITSKYIHNNSIDFENAYSISEIDYININKRSKVETNDILFSMIGTIGLIYLEENAKIDYTIKNIGLIKTSQNDTWKYFVYLWFKSEIGKDWIFENKTGSTQEYIPLNSLRNIKFRIKSIEQIKEFNQLIGCYFFKIKINKKQIQVLIQTRDSLLSKLMCNEINI